MKLELELTDPMIQQVRGHDAALLHWPEGHVRENCFLCAASAALPKDPRDMPPGVELDKLVDTAVGTDYQGSWWSRDPSTIGFMLNWLHEHGHDPLISYTAWRGSWHVTLGGARHFYGETSAHALARAIATIGGKG